MNVAFEGHLPQLLPGSFAAPNITAVGRLTLSRGASLWYGVVARADRNTIHIGEGTNIQDNSVLHVSPVHPMRIGRGVTVGHGAILHGCTVEDNCLIGMGAILMNGCVIGAGSLIAAGALISENTVIPPGSLVMGSPGRIRRELSAEEITGISTSAALYRQLAQGQLEEQ